MAHRLILLPSPFHKLVLHPKRACPQTGQKGTRRKQTVLLLAGKGKIEAVGGHMGTDPLVLTSGGLQPLVLHAVAHLGLGVALGQVAGDDGRVALVHLNHVLAVKLEVLEICAGNKARTGLLAWCWQRTGAVPSKQFLQPELPCAHPELQQPASLLRAPFVQKKYGNREPESANRGHLPLPRQAAAATPGRGHPPCARPSPPNPSKCPWAVWRAGGHKGSWRAGSTQPSLGSRAGKKMCFCSLGNIAALQEQETRLAPSFSHPQSWKSDMKFLKQTF